MEQTIAQRSAPKNLHCDNGKEFNANELVVWVGYNNVEHALNRPAALWQNDKCDNSNWIYCYESLDTGLIHSVEHARFIQDQWR